MVGVALAAFSDSGNVLGSTFSVGSADIRLLSDVAGGTDVTNLVEELPGPTFTDISPNWSTDYLIKIFNNGTSSVDLASHANYVTANDPEDLRQIIFVEPFYWDDVNGNGVVDTGEEGASLGRKTIVKWNTEGFALGNLDTGNVVGLILRFSTDNVSDTKQGASMIVDFEFESVGV
jgi:hypothetical protein